MTAQVIRHYKAQVRDNTRWMVVFMAVVDALLVVNDLYIMAGH